MWGNTLSGPESEFEFGSHCSFCRTTRGKHEVVLPTSVLLIVAIGTSNSGTYLPRSDLQQALAERTPLRDEDEPPGNLRRRGRKQTPKTHARRNYAQTKLLKRCAEQPVLLEKHSFFTSLSVLQITEERSSFRSHRHSSSEPCCRREASEGAARSAQSSGRQGPRE